MTGSCKFDGCTVDDTGTCALERAPALCDNRTKGKAESASCDTGGDAPEIGAPVLASPSKPPSFPPSGTLGTEDIDRMMSSRYVTVVGILGEPDAGKTACLASLYLLVSNGILRGWSFSRSSSLMGLEDIARGAREWNEGHPPEQMTLHTEMADDRQAGFLHLRLKRASDGRRVDFVLPDLPGEWTKTLVVSKRTDRLEFLKAADTVWLVVDGKALRQKPMRLGAIAKLGQLAGRLQNMTEDSAPRVLVVVTHRDMGKLDQNARELLTAELAKHAVSAEIVEVAPFAEGGACTAGFGIDELIDITAGRPPERPPFWATRASTPGARAFLSYRRWP